MALFIVDRVLPGMTAALVAEAQRCLQQAAHRVAGDGEAVRYLRSTSIPEQQRCLDLFEAASAAVVRQVNEIAQVPFRSIGLASEDSAPGTGV